MNSFEAYPRRSPALAERLTLGLDAERAGALRDVWVAMLSSRVLVWLAGVGAILAFGFGAVRHAFDPPGTTRGFGWLGDLLAGPAARWDSAWYLVIAQHGYRPEFGALTASRTAFFPLYPLGLSAIAGLGIPVVLAGVLLSLAALGVGLYGLHRLTTLESGSREVGRVAVLLTALSPMGFYLSAVYSESLYLALSVGMFLCARRGRWGFAAGLAGLAGATRSTGVLLGVPLALLYLYGPREDRSPDREGVSQAPDRPPARELGPPRSDRPPDRALGSHIQEPAQPVRRLARALIPRYRVRRDALWVGLVPVGLGLYLGHLALAGGEALSPFQAQVVWGRRFAGPYGAVWDGAQAAFQGARQLLSLQRRHVYFPAAGGSPFIDAGHNLMLFAFLLLALPALVGVLRRLPLAYGVYVLAGLALPLSYPVPSQPLMSLPRFLLVMFPLNMWLAGWLLARGGDGRQSGMSALAGARAGVRGRAVALALSASAIALGCFAAQFATWHWVA